jgi:hypothetical protein
MFVKRSVNRFYAGNLGDKNVYLLNPIGGNLTEYGTNYSTIIFSAHNKLL